MSYLAALWKRIRPNQPEGRWEDYFTPGEQLLWDGAPEPGIPFSIGMAGLSIFGLPFLAAGLAVCAVGLASIVQFGGWVEAATGLGIFLFGLPFAGVGFALVFGTWMSASMVHAFVRYAITDQRVYVAKSWWSRDITSTPVPATSQITLHRARFDTVRFAAQATPDSDGDLVNVHIDLSNIKDGKRVYDLLRRLQATAKD